MRDFRTTTRKPGVRVSGTRLSPMAVAVLLLLVAALGVWGLLFLKEKVNSQDKAGTSPGSGNGVLDSQRIASMQPSADAGGPFNVLVLGLDKVTGSKTAASNTRTDTMMVVQVDPGTGGIRLLSIPRDLLVEVAPGKEDRINTAYEHGGVRNVVQVVENFAGIPIDHYAVVNFKGFKDVVRTIGGVKINVDKGFPEKWHMPPGIQTLNGNKALFYARYRGTSGGDLDRIRRQQQMVAALRSQLLKWSTIPKMPELVSILEKNVKTDMGTSDALVVGKALIEKGRGAPMTAVQLKGKPETRKNGDEVLVPDRRENDTALQYFRH